MPKKKGSLPKQGLHSPIQIYCWNGQKNCWYMKKRAGVDTEELSNTPARGRGSVKVALPDHPLTTSEWAKFKRVPPNERFEMQMMEGLLATNADINIAKSLLAYVVRTKAPFPMSSFWDTSRCVSRVATTRRCLTLTTSWKLALRLLNTGASSLFIKGFSQTERWKEALVVLEGMKKALLPSPRNYVMPSLGRHFMVTLRRAGCCTMSSWNWVSYLIRTPGSACFRAASLSEDKRKTFSVLSHERYNQIYPEEPLIQTIKLGWEVNVKY